MDSITLFKNRETPVRWKSFIPGFVLTSGIDNEVEIRIQDNPEVGECVAIPAGTLIITLRRMGDISAVVKRFDPVIILGNQSSVPVVISLPDNFSRGYYRLHVVHKNDVGKSLGVYDAWVAVDQAVDPRPDNHMEVNSVRSQFSDLCGNDNKMLDGLEIGVGDIAEAVERCLQQWIATAPRTSKYYGDSFPYPELLRNGVLSMLLQSICTLLDRNRLVYQAEGVAVDIEKRTEYYKQLRAEYNALWRSGMMQMKNEENVNAFDNHIAYL